MASSCVSSVHGFLPDEEQLQVARREVEASGMLFTASIGGPADALAWLETADGWADYLVVDTGVAVNCDEAIARFREQIAAIDEACRKDPHRVPPVVMFVGAPIRLDEATELFDLGLNAWLLRSKLGDELARALADWESERRSSGVAVDGDRMIAVVGTGGGAGASMLAANVAWRVARQGRSVLLIEADLLNGRQAGYYGLPMDRGADEAAKLFADPAADKAMLERVAKSRPVAGMPNLSVLSAFQLPGAQNAVRADAASVERVIALSQRSFDVVVLDVSVSDYPLGREVFAGRMAVAATPTCESLETALRLMEAARRHKTKTTLLLNRIDEHDEGGPSPTRFADALQLDEDSEIALVPYDRRVLGALVQGQSEAPLVEERGELGDAFRRAVAMALGEPVPEASSGGWFGMFKELFA